MKKTVFSFTFLCFFYLIDAQTNFSNVAISKGINHNYGTGQAAGGVSFSDFDGDGLDDITLASENGEPISFYKNTGGVFVQQSNIIDHQEESKQVLWVDFDNDGDKDFYVGTFDGINRLYENTGNLTFIDITQNAGLPMIAKRTFGVCWGDYDRDGWLDLYYTERDTIGGNNIHRNRLFRNNADGTFEDKTVVSGVEDPNRLPFCAAFFDYNDDKWPDIYIANDKGKTNSFFINNGNGTFEDAGETANADLVMDAMSVAVGDYDNNGWSDIYITNIAVGSKFLHNSGNSTGFQEVAESTGTGFYGIGWGANFLDGDLDGDLDLYVSGMLVGADEISSVYYENELIETGIAIFSQPDAGFIGDTVQSFNNAIGDFNNDGRPDILVQNGANFKAQLWQNNSTVGNYLKVKLEGVLSNRDGVGAKIEFFNNGYYQMRFTHCGIGFLGQNSETEIIGLGDSEMIDSIRVTWPTGHIDRLFNIEVNQKLDILEGSTTSGEIEVDEDVTLTIVSTENVLLTENEIEVFPNPTTDILNINLIDFEAVKQLVILNSVGQIIENKKIQTSDIQLDVANYLSGIYFGILINGKGKRCVFRFEKM